MREGIPAISLWKEDDFGGKICKPCEDRRQRCVKVLSNVPFAGKEVDSVIHSAGTSQKRAEGAGRWGVDREGSEG